MRTTNWGRLATSCWLWWGAQDNILLQPFSLIFFFLYFFLPWMFLMLWCIGFTRNWGESVAGGHFSSVWFPDCYEQLSDHAILVTIHLWRFRSASVQHDNYYMGSYSSACSDESFSWSYAEWSCATLLGFCACWLEIRLQQFTRKRQYHAVFACFDQVTECLLVFELFLLNMFPCAGTLSLHWFTGY